MKSNFKILDLDKIPDRSDTLWSKLINKYDDYTWSIRYHYNDIKYWVLHRVNPKMWQYWMVKPKTLKIGYHDPDILLLHSCMQLLVDFYEFEASDKGTTCWTHNDETKRIFCEMRMIYEWWTCTWVEQNELLETMYQYDMGTDEIMRLESKIFDGEQEMLKRLIDIRPYLWD